MKRMGLLKAGAIGLACLGMLIPTPVLHAAADDGGSQREAEGRTPASMDVALHEGGRLFGQVVDAQGIPLVRAPVRLRQLDQEVAVTRTDRYGYFQVQGLRGGTYQIVAGPANGVYRLWAPRTAPPAAQPGALVVAGGQQVLGQNGPLGHLFGNPWIVAGLVATAIAVPVAIYNHQIDRNETPASP